MESNEEDKISRELWKHKLVWGKKRILVAYYAYIPICILNIVSEIMFNGVFTNFAYKLLIFFCFGSFFALSTLVFESPQKLA